MFEFSCVLLIRTMPHKLQKQLKELGSKLKSPPASKDALLKLLKVICLFNCYSFC